MDSRDAQELDCSTRTIVALDTDCLEDACRWVEELIGLVRVFKVGSQLFTRVGPPAVKAIKERGGEVFLDLKYHDIPNTVSRAVTAAADLGVRFLTIHALGGDEMIRQAVESAHTEALRLGVEPTLIMAVTILTSMDEEDLISVGLEGGIGGCVIRLADVAVQSGVKGLVASPNEVGALRQRFGRDILLVTPGIRPAPSQNDDQKRVMGPREALEAGADYLVMGRSLLDSPNPLGMLRSMR